MGYKEVNPVSFGERAIESERFVNKRAEMWVMLRDWFKETVSVPDNDDVHADVTCVPDYLERSDGRIKLESKEKIKQDYGRSPDIGDALALTFAYPVNAQKRKKVSKAKPSKAKWKSGRSK